MNKYWRAFTREEYLYKMDLVDIINACEMAGFPDGVRAAIWEKKRKFGEVFRGK